MTTRLTLLLFGFLMVVACQETSVKSAGAVKASTKVVTKDTFGINYIMGHFDPATHPDFVKIPASLADREGMYLRKDALKDFIRMHNAARTEGIELQIRSATRNFDYQKGIWERKWTGETILSDGVNASTDIDDGKERALKILEYSSMPGTSRHHWGTDIDLNSFSNDWFGKGEGLKLYNWMLAHAAQYGYCQPYTAKGELRPDGYNEEKWHWSYTPIAQQLLNEAQDNLANEMIKGFLGSEEAVNIDVVNKYVLGVNPQCK
jgi:LAS superfamily LD-carboxypeptidase LdcB